MKNVYVLGSVNMDMVISAPYVPNQGETLTGSNFFLNGGGKGANQAVAVSKQNVKTYLIANVGNDVFGQELYNNLKNYNIETTYITKLNNTATGVAMIIITNNDNRIILDGGANVKITTTQIDNALNNAKEDDIFITQLENNLDAVLYGLKKAKAKKMTTIFNPAPAIKLDKNIFQYVDYLIVNEGECELLSDIKIDSKDNILKAYHSLNVKSLIITLGSKGSLYINNDLITSIEPNKIKAIDTTAAGDTYVGIFASQLVNKVDVISALKYASIGSSLTCLKKGAQQSIPYQNEIEDYLKSK